MDHCAGSEEQERLKDGMGKQMKHRCGITKMGS